MNTELLDQMLSVVQKAKGGDIDKVIVLDQSTFSTALTDDIHLYDIRNEGRATTNLDDVLLTDGGKKVQNVCELDASRELCEEDIESRASLSTLLTIVPTAPAIDSTAGTYRSKHLIILLWATGECCSGNLTE